MLLVLADLGLFLTPVVFSCLGAGGFLTLVSPRLPGRSRWRVAAVPLIVLGAAAVLFSPPGEFVLGGWDPGVYFNTGMVLSTGGGFTVRDPLLTSAGPGAEAALIRDFYLQPGFYWDGERAAITTQFPFLLAVWTGVAVLAGGPAAGLYVPVVVGALAVLAFFLLVRQLAGTGAALSSAALLAFNGLELWHARLSLAEEMAQLFLFSGLWAGLVWREGGGRVAAIASGLALGVLPLVKTEGALLGVLGSLGIAWPARAVQGARSFWGVYLGVSLVAALHYATLAWPVASGQIAAAWPFAILAGALVLLSGFVVRPSDRPREQGPLLRGLRVTVLPAGATGAAFAATLLALVGGLKPPPQAPDLGLIGALWHGLYLTPLDGALLLLAPAVLAAQWGRPGPRRGLGSVWPSPVVPVLVILLLGGVFYLVLFHHYYGARDEIPLFMWATRRLVPTLLPLVILLEVLTLTALVRLLPSPRWQAPCLTALVALMLAFRVPDVAALRDVREYLGALDAAAVIAARTEADAVLLLDGDDAGIRFAAPLRFMAGRPSYLLRAETPPAGVRDLIAAAAGEGRSVYYLASAFPHLALAGYQLDLLDRWRFQLPELERTSDHRPARIIPFTAELALFRVGTLGP